MKKVIILMLVLVMIFALSACNASKAEKELDLSGRWTNYYKFPSETYITDITMNIVVEMDISNFTVDNFDAAINWGSYSLDGEEKYEGSSDSGHFERTTEAPGTIAYGAEAIYVDEHHNYILFFYADSGEMLIRYCPGGRSVTIFTVKITEDQLVG